MEVRQISQQAGEWLRGAGPQGEVVISSRIRLARNLAGHPFVNRANRRQRLDVLERCRSQISASRVGKDIWWVDLSSVEELDRLLLMERHLISRQLAQGGAEVPRAVAIDRHETFAIMVNEEDHLRIQVLRSGMQLSEAFAQITQLDDALEEVLDFAYSKRWGYLTACPTNVGTGIRVSVMVHLPGLKLTGEIEKVKRAARDMHLAVRGFFGEGSEALGDLFQVSNQTTLGRTEEEILHDFEKQIVPAIISYEQQARQALMRSRTALLEDKIWRAWAILTHARVISAEEVMSLLSYVRLGVLLGRIQQVDLSTVNELFLITQPAHLQRLTGCGPDQTSRREARAKLVRQRLGVEAN